MSTARLTSTAAAAAAAAAATARRSWTDWRAVAQPASSEVALCVRALRWLKPAAFCHQANTSLALAPAALAPTDRLGKCAI